MNIDKNRFHEEMMKNIEIPDTLEQLVEDSVEEGYAQMKKRRYKRTAAVKRAAVILCVLAGGFAVAVPVKAFIGLVRERMEQVPREEIELISEVLEEQAVVADGFSRDYTETERKRMGELRTAYEGGTFPEKELGQKPTADEGMAEELYFAQDTSVFYLPDRELTDEELLEIIDFNTKRDFSLEEKSREKAEEERIREQKAAEKIESAGGVSEAVVLKAATDWLDKLYGVSADKMEEEIWLEQEGGLSDAPVYCVSLKDGSSQFYRFTLDSRDAALLSATILYSGERDTKAVSVAQMEEKRDLLCEKAQEALHSQLGKTEEYDRIVCSYTDADGYLGSYPWVAFSFIKEDGSAYEIAMDVSSEQMSGYDYRADYEEYRELEERTAEEFSAVAKPEGDTVYQELQ